ncbi:hypothetical protein [Piscirickettsia salmonis]|uniref:hypothetical protein n=1 Tax=Piscirickettsia salmonis TaxID=1238 RepID=UPI0007C8A2D2|nr:hypothetical protein A0O36_02844 [Piscirickettsiaceae bacterium NZ-RLO1]
MPKQKNIPYRIPNPSRRWSNKNHIYNECLRYAQAIQSQLSNHTYQTSDCHKDFNNGLKELITELRDDYMLKLDNGRSSGLAKDSPGWLSLHYLRDGLSSLYQDLSQGFNYLERIEIFKKDLDIALKPYLPSSFQSHRVRASSGEKAYNKLIKGCSEIFAEGLTDTSDDTLKKQSLIRKICLASTKNINFGNGSKINKAYGYSQGVSSKMKKVLNTHNVLSNYNDPGVSFEDFKRVLQSTMEDMDTFNLFRSRNNTIFYDSISEGVDIEAAAETYYNKAFSN